MLNAVQMGPLGKTKRDSLKNEWILNEYGPSTKVTNQYEGSIWWWFAYINRMDGC